MAKQDIINEIIAALNNLKANEVIDLSSEAGNFLLETVNDMQENGEI